MHIRDFQELMRELYLDKDTRRGEFETFTWLMEEVGELAEAIRRGDTERMKIEVADVLAWLSSLCNILAVDMESVAALRYGGGCPKCSASPCACPDL